MQRHTRPVNPQTLGVIGKEHLRIRLLAMRVQPDSFRYCRRFSSAKSKKTSATTDDQAGLNRNLPWVLESAFGWLGNEAEDDRLIFAGANWSAAIHNPFRAFGATGEGLEAELTDLRAGQSEPIVFALHLAHPRVEYADRGKSALVIRGE
jgi:hypothetical protein